MVKSTFKKNGLTSKESKDFDKKLSNITSKTAKDLDKKLTKLRTEDGHKIAVNTNSKLKYSS